MPLGLVLVLEEGVEDELEEIKAVLGDEQRGGLRGSLRDQGGRERERGERGEGRERERRREGR